MALLPNNLRRMEHHHRCAVPRNTDHGTEAMDGNLQVAARSTLNVGYDLTAAGAVSPESVTVTNPQIVFSLGCSSAATTTVPTLTAIMPTATYPVTGSDWSPSSDQTSSLTYQGTVTVPNACGGTGNSTVLLSQGGAFSATITTS
jgi:hypothetical protein